MKIFNEVIVLIIRAFVLISAIVCSCIITFILLNVVVAFWTKTEFTEILKDTVKSFREDHFLTTVEVKIPEHLLFEDFPLLILILHIYGYFNFLIIMIYPIMSAYSLTITSLYALPNTFIIIETLFDFYFTWGLLPILSKSLIATAAFILYVPYNLFVLSSWTIVYVANINSVTQYYGNVWQFFYIPRDFIDLIKFLIDNPTMNQFNSWLFSFVEPLFTIPEIIFDKIIKDFVWTASFIYPTGLLLFLICTVSFVSHFVDIVPGNTVSTVKKEVLGVNKWYKNFLVITGLLIYNCIFFIYCVYNINFNNFYNHNPEIYKNISELLAVKFDRYFLVNTAFLTLIIILFILITFNKLVNLLDLNTIIVWILSILALIILTQLSDLFLVYLGIVILSLSLYPLISLDKKSKGNLEAAVKYFFLGAFASGIMLFGLTLIYKELNTLNYLNLKNLDFTYFQKDSSKFTLLCGFVFVIFGFFFKLSLVPLQNWTPDVYLGSPIITTCFLATAVKFSIYCTFFRAYYTVILKFFSDSAEFKNIFIVFSIASIIVGALGAIDQFKIRRLIGFATINQMGFILLGISLQNLYGFIASYVYLCIYVILNLIFFIFILNIKPSKNKELVYISDLIPFFKTNKLPAIFFIILLFSLAGMPPTIGFYMKLLMLKALVISGYIKLTLVLLYINILSIFYYARIIKIVFFDAEKLEIVSRTNVSSGSKNIPIVESSLLFDFFKSPFVEFKSINDILNNKGTFLKFIIFIFNQLFYYGLLSLFLSGVMYYWFSSSHVCCDVLGHMWADVRSEDYTYYENSGINACIRHFLKVV